jgi:hypothetical protein
MGGFSNILGSSPGPLDDVELSFRRTVDRELVHRRALSEVFLTDFRPTGDDGFVAAAQLPPSHAYYTDHLGSTRHVDPFLLLECCRQAETYAGHDLLGVPLDHRFVLREWSLRLGGPVDMPVGGAPPELVVTGAVHNPVRRGEQLRGITFDMGLTVSRTRVGALRMVVAYLPGNAYDLLRRRARGGAPPLSDNVRDTGTGTPVPARRVGRANPANVVLAAVETAGPRATAVMAAPFAHPSLFDHPQDHIPGMVLMEGARQLALAALADGPGHPVADPTVVELAATFGRYAELDVPTLLRAETSGGVNGSPREAAVRVTFEQERDPVAQAVIRLA